jgi:hypothetical protein
MLSSTGQMILLGIELVLIKNNYQERLYYVNSHGKTSYFFNSAFFTTFSLTNSKKVFVYF